MLSKSKKNHADSNDFKIFFLLFNTQKFGVPEISFRHHYFHLPK